MNTSKSKKIFLSAVLVGAVALAGFHTASARPVGGGPYGWGGGQCDECGYGLQQRGGYGYQQQQQLDEQTLESRDKFLADTATLRKEIATKTAEKRALMLNDNPDAGRVAKLTGELFDLREQLQNKAQESGIQNAGLRGRGYGRGCDGPGSRRFQRPL